MSGTAKIICVTGTKETGKTDFSKNNLKEALKSRINSRALVLDVFDNPVWRTQETYNDKANNTPIPIIPKEKIAYWPTSPEYSSQRLLRVADSDVGESFRLAAKYFSNGVLYVEDATKFIRNGRLTKAQAALIYDCKQKSVDVVLSFHMIKRIPAELAEMTDILVVGKSKDQYNSKMEDMFPYADLDKVLKFVYDSENRFIKVKVDVSV